MRRLDNERQYLKSQLQSEITCKDELREALATATRQLGDIKVCGVVYCTPNLCHTVENLKPADFGVLM